MNPTRQRKRVSRPSPGAGSLRVIPGGKEKNPKPTGRVPWRPLPLTALLILLGTLAVYAPALNGGYLGGGDRALTGDPSLRSLRGLWDIWTGAVTGLPDGPLTQTSFWLDYHLWGTAPFADHLINVVLHALNAALLYALLRRIAIPGALFAAAIFAVHPVHVEAVAWISDRGTLLSLSFYLLALLAWLQFQRRRRSRAYSAALLCFAAAVLSNAVACTLPVVLVLISWWRDPLGWRRHLRRIAPFFALGLSAAAMVAWRARDLAGDRTILQPWVLDRLLVAGRALWFYPAKLLWPATLMTVYPQWQISPADLSQYAFLFAAVAVPAALWSRRRRLGGGPLLGVAFYGVTIAPVLGLFPRSAAPFAVADHLQYAASIGLIAVFAAVCSLESARLGLGRRHWRAALAAPVLIVLGVLTWDQSLLYQSSEKLWRDSARKNPDAWLAHYNLGVDLAEQGRIEEAVDHLSTSVRLRPDDPFARNQLGVALARQGKLDEAMRHLSEAVLLDPQYAEAHGNLGMVRHRQHHLSEAIAELNEALRIDPQLTQARQELELALAEQHAAAP